MIWIKITEAELIIIENEEIKKNHFLKIVKHQLIAFFKFYNK